MNAVMPFDPALLWLSVALAAVSAYAAFEIIDRIRASAGTMQAVWIIGGGIATGVSFWAAQYLGMLAFGMPQAHLYFVVAQLSRVVSMIVAGIALYVAALSPLDRRSRFASGLTIATGVVFGHSIAIASTAARPSRITIDWLYVGLELAVTTIFANVCLAMALRLRTLTGRRAFGVRIAAALVMATSISLLLFTGRHSIPVAYLGDPADLVQLDRYLIAIIALVGGVLAIGSIAAARFDRRIRGERARSRRLEDLYTRQKRTALALQRALLPSDPPVVDGVTFSWSYVPSTAEDIVGGDWFDAFVLDDGRVALSIGDAAGHDTQAVIAMNIARQALRNAALDHADPSDVLAHVNRALLHANHPSLVTAVYGLLDPMTLTFAYACAGHPPPIRARAGTRAAMIDGIGTGLPLGLFADAPATTHVLDLYPDDMLVFFTDGVIERERDLIAGIASLERAADVLAATGAPDTATLLDRAIFGDGMRPDDAAIMTVRLEAALHEIDMRVAAIPQNVGRIRSAMRRFIDSLEVDEEVAHAILLATGEAVANAVEHAYAGDAEPGDVLVRVRADGEQAEVVIEDFGRWARGESDPERGRGLGLMRELASVASIEKASSGTIVRLDFALAPRATPLPSRAVTTPR